MDTLMLSNQSKRWRWMDSVREGERCCIATYNFACIFKNMHLHAETSLTGNDDFNNERIYFFIKI